MTEARPLTLAAKLWASPQRMADLVRRELADPVERGSDDARVGACAESGQRALTRCLSLPIGCQQALEQPDVLAHTQRAQGDVPLQDLARARVGDRVAVAPATRRAMDPLHDVEAHVLWIRAFWQELDAKPVRETGLCEDRFPVARAFQQGGSNRLRSGAIDVVHDRALGGKVMPKDDAHVQGLVDRTRRVTPAAREEAAARIECPRVVVVALERRKLDERVLQAERERRGIGRRGADLGVLDGRRGT